jgi:pimeloyl-ACP methyl ester carboxylesterase
VNGLSVHVLEAGDPRRPCVLLLHGFPELAYSWRKVMPALADAGYYVIAPDQRGYGETTGWNIADLASFSLGNIARDAALLIEKLDIEKAHLVGHDFGSFVAGAAALLYPHLWRSVVFMSAPWGGAGATRKDPGAELAKLRRKHYQWYYSTPAADRDMRECRQGLHAFLRAYYHVKSADWPGNRPHPLKEWSGAELARLPRYYVMDLDKDIAETVAPHMPVRAAAWLTDAELDVYADAFASTTFQGGLNWYTCGTRGLSSSSLASVSGRAVALPACYIAGAADWGVYQNPGAFERMQTGAVCADWRGAHLVEGAGHWVQQEQPARVTELLLELYSTQMRPTMRPPST